MGSTSYSSNFPRGLFSGGLQAERITQDADVLAQARDHNIHDKEIQATQQAVGIHVEGTAPTGTVLERLWSLEHGGVGSQVHHIDGSLHSGQLSLNRTNINVTNVLGNAINSWMVKMFGTGDLDGDGYTTIQDALGGLAINKEFVDDTLLAGFHYPWQIPTGANPIGEPVPPPPPGPPPPPPPGTGGWDPGDPSVPLDEVWCGLGDIGGLYDQAVGMMIDFDTGASYGVKRYMDATHTTLVGAQTLAGISYLEVWGAPALGTHYGLMYWRKPVTTGVRGDGGTITNSAGAFIFEDKQALLSTTNDMVSVDLGDHVAGGEIANTSGAGAHARVAYDGGAGEACGFVDTLDPTISAGELSTRLVAPFAGKFTLYVVTSSAANNGAGASWNIIKRYKVDGGATVSGNDVIVPNVAKDTPERKDLYTGITLSKDEVIHASLVLLDTGAHNGVLVLHSFGIECTELT